jgi:hypothetical protein
MDHPIVLMIKKLDVVELFKNERITLSIENKHTRAEGVKDIADIVNMQIRIKKDGTIELFCDKSIKVQPYSKWYTTDGD